MKQQRDPPLINIELQIYVTKGALSRNGLNGGTSERSFLNQCIDRKTLFSGIQICLGGHAHDVA